MRDAQERTHYFERQALELLGYSAPEILPFKIRTALEAAYEMGRNDAESAATESHERVVAREMYRQHEGDISI